MISRTKRSLLSYINQCPVCNNTPAAPPLTPRSLWWKPSNKPPAVCMCTNTSTSAYIASQTHVFVSIKIVLDFQYFTFTFSLLELSYWFSSVSNSFKKTVTLLKFKLKLIWSWTGYQHFPMRVPLFLFDKLTNSRLLSVQSSCI